MSDVLSIAPLTQARPAAAQVAKPQAEAEAAPATEVAKATGPNPSYSMDPSLGIVVMTVRDAGGSTSITIPSYRMLAAYRDGSTPVPTAASQMAQQTEA